MNHTRKIWLMVIAMVVPMAIVLLSSCNAQKKNTAAARQYTAFITRYNIYYNGDKHYKETLDNMEKKYEDDYSRLVYMHPVEAKNDKKSPQPSGDFNRSIEKAQKAIQLRSIKKKPAKKAGKNDPEYKAWMAREEYNPFLHNAWMMMGRSQYFNGDFLGAASTFFYVVKHFTWLPATVTEAKLWQAQSYVSLDWLYEAEVIITRIKPDELTDNNLKGLYNFVFADFEVKSDNYEKAIPYLEQAIKYNSGAQKSRLQFLLGQLYARIGNKEAAYRAYKAAGGSASVPYRTKFNARIKQSEVYSGDNIEPEVKALKRMTRYDRNKEYLDQIYYAIGNLYLSRGDTLNAIENYELAAKKSTRSGIDKAISQITLGELYFKMRNYEKAQPCYSEAVPQLPETYPDYKTLKRRSDVLDELALYSGNVNLQDSLLRLSGMSEEEQLAVVNKIIDELKKKEREEAENVRREEYLANQAATGSNMRQPGASAPTAFNINSDDSWYFYNDATRSAGKTDFQKRWGSRKLEDDWRRRNKTSFNASDFDAPSAEGEDDEFAAESDSIAADENAVAMTPEEKKKQEQANDPHYPEFYLKQIPKTDEEKATANEVIQEGLYNMGVILKDKLEDYPASLAEFNRLLGDYPDNTYRLDTYYNLYLMFMREGDRATAETYRKMILDDFADSNYGMAMRDPDYLDKLRAMDSIQNNLYEQTYDDYLNNRNDNVHAAYDKMQEMYPLSKIMPKFMFLDALAYVTESNTEKFNAVLRDMLDRYPDTDIAPIASAWLKGMAQGKELHADGTGSNLRGMIWDIHLSNDSTAVASDSPANFEIAPDQPQLLVFVYPTDRVDANVLLYEVARHNFQSFVVKDFDLEQMNFGQLGMLVVKGFDNVSELDNYRRVLAASGTFKLPADVRPIPISVKNLETMLNEGRTFDDYFRFLQQLDYESTQAAMLQPEDIETLQQAEEREEERIKREAADTEDVIDMPEPVETPAAPTPAEESVVEETEIEVPAVQEPETEAPETETPAEPVANTIPDETPEPAAEPAQPATPQPAVTQPAQTSKPTPDKQPAPAVVKEKEPAVIPTLPAKPVAPRRVLPDYDPGSEGDDDPLLM